MKRTLCFLLCTLLIVVLCGCTPKFVYNSLDMTTESYQHYKFFEKYHKVGMHKSQVAEQLGTPASHGHISGDTCHTSRYSADFPDHVMERECITWVYSCSKYSDSDYYRLYVRFDEEGKLISAELKGVPGN